jgi:ATP-dependent Clp protease protease subunit
MPPKRKKVTLHSFDPREILHLHRQLFLYGPITDSVAHKIKQNLVAFDIVSNTPITLWLSSPGGSCSAGLSIIEIMKKIQSPVVTIINAEVASMAAMISICGDQRYAFHDTGVWMNHPIHSGQIDYLPFIIDRTAFLLKYNEVMQKIMRDNTKLNEDDYKKIEAGELWLFPDKLIEKGIVDKLL